jgi:hypothetical protein
MRALNENGETFSGLHRAEGGFACITGPGFQSTETDESHGQSPTGMKVRKAVRFQRFSGRINWPSCDHSFASAKDEDVIFPDDFVL